MRRSRGNPVGDVFVPRLVAAAEYEFIAAGQSARYRRVRSSEPGNGVSPDGQAVVGVSLSSAGWVRRGA